MPDEHDKLIPRAKRYPRQTYGEDTVSMDVTRKTVHNGTGVISVECTVSSTVCSTPWNRMVRCSF